jgi:transposase
MKYKHIIGIDVSKGWLDFTVLEEGSLLFYERVQNSNQGINLFHRKLKLHKSFKPESGLFCMEHTGIYNNHLLDFLDKKKLNICLESGIQIKHSSGLKRGKSDKIDSQRIAIYAFKNQEEIKLWKPQRAILNKLKQLTTLRSRLVNVIKQLKTPVKEAIGFNRKSEQNIIIKACKKSISSLESDLKSLNTKILEIIHNDEDLKRLYNIVTSVPGIGNVTAVEIIITTNEFKNINCPKKYACYSGVAPFEHQSGSSIRGKTRVSSMGNKCIKKLLHLAALSVSSRNGELREYYLRKVQEGKNKMLVINAIRNKLIARVFTCVSQDRLYQKNLVPTIA